MPSLDDVQAHGPGALGLAPYSACPGGKPDACSFGPPVVTITGSDVHVCGTCGHGVTRPAMPDVASLYDDRGSQDYQGRDGRLAAAIKAFVFRRQAKAMAALFPADTATAYDFGCGSGVLTRALDRAMPGTAWTGLDFFDDPPAGLADTRYASLAAAEALPKADLLSAFHVLEHDDDPAALLDRFKRYLRPRGVVVLEVPNVRCAGTRLFGANWDNWYLPFHRTHFSEESLRCLLIENGFEILSIEKVCVPSMGRSLARWLGRPNTLAFILAGAICHPLQMAMERVTGQPSALRVTAKAIA